MPKNCCKTVFRPSQVALGLKKLFNCTQHVILCPFSQPMFHFAPPSIIQHTWLSNNATLIEGQLESQHSYHKSQLTSACPIALECLESHPRFVTATGNVEIGPRCCSNLCRFSPAALKVQRLSADRFSFVVNFGECR